MHLAESRPQLQGSLHWLFSQHPLPNELVFSEAWLLLAALEDPQACSARLPSPGQQMASCLHPRTQKMCSASILQSFSSSHTQHWLWDNLQCRLQSSWTAVFSLHLPFFLSSFSLPLFFGTLTFQLQAKQPLLFFSWFSRITSSETLWHFKNKSIYLCYLYKPLPLTPGFLFRFETRLQRVWCFPPLVPASSLGCAAQRCCLVMFESRCGRLLQKGLSHCLSEWIQHPLNIELD